MKRFTLCKDYNCQNFKEKNCTTDSTEYYQVLYVRDRVHLP